jgi:hypothetical protein
LAQARQVCGERRDIVDLGCTANAIRVIKLEPLERQQRGGREVPRHLVRLHFVEVVGVTGILSVAAVFVTGAVSFTAVSFTAVTFTSVSFTAVVSVSPVTSVLVVSARGCLDVRAFSSGPLGLWLVLRFRPCSSSGIHRIRWQ